MLLVLLLALARLGRGWVVVSLLSPCLALTRCTVWCIEVLSLLGLIGPSRQL